jgi:PAS domain S-box-containing protein
MLGEQMTLADGGLDPAPAAADGDALAHGDVSLLEARGTFEPLLAAQADPLRALEQMQALYASPAVDPLHALKLQQIADVRPQLTLFSTAPAHAEAAVAAAAAAAPAAAAAATASPQRSSTADDMSDAPRDCAEVEEEEKEKEEEAEAAGEVEGEEEEEEEEAEEEEDDDPSDSDVSDYASRRKRAPRRRQQRNAKRQRAGGSGGARGDALAERRRKHNQVEIRRRQRIKENMDELSALIHFVPDSRDKFSVLGAAHARLAEYEAAVSAMEASLRARPPQPATQLQLPPPPPPPPPSPPVDHDALFHTSRVPMFVGAVAGHIAECNEAFAALLGYSRDELVGTTCLALSHESDLPLLFKTMNDFLSGAASHVRGLKRMRHKQGHYVLLQSVVWAVRGAGRGGRPTHIQGVMVPVPEVAAQMPPAELAATRAPPLPLDAPALKAEPQPQPLQQPPQQPLTSPLALGDAALEFSLVSPGLQPPWLAPPF